MLAGQVSIEQYEVALGLRRSIPQRGAVVRLARFKVDPARITEAVSLVREETATQVKGVDGLRSFPAAAQPGHRRGHGAGLLGDQGGISGVLAGRPATPCPDQ